MIFRNEDNVVVGEVGGKGKSLFAKRSFVKDEVIIVVAGKVVTYNTDYTVPIDHDLRIEPREPGNEAQFLCHSCEPNVGVRDRTLIVALRDIVVDEEVLISYAMLGYEYGHERSQDGRMPISYDLSCCCGAARCVGVLQCYKHMPPEWRQRYRTYVSDYLLDNERYPYIPQI
jgi:uncharacterized protein